MLKKGRTGARVSVYPPNFVSQHFTFINSPFSLLDDERPVPVGHAEPAGVGQPKCDPMLRPRRDSPRGK